METLKVCNLCKANLPDSSYGLKKGRLQSRCNPCKAKWMKDYISTPKGKKSQKDSYYKSKYRMSFDDVKELVEKQGNRCRICHSIFNGYLLSESPCVDHNHTTGKVRGVLCNSCNRGIGYLRDNPMYLMNAAQYLMEEDQPPKGGQ